MVDAERAGCLYAIASELRGPVAMRVQHSGMAPRLASLAYQLEQIADSLLDDEYS